MKRFLCLILAICMVIPFASCAETPTETESEKTTEAATEAETNEFGVGINRKNYGKTFQMIGRTEPGKWYFAKEQTKELLNDAIYDMNQRVNDYLGVTIAYEQVTNIVTGGEVFDRVQPSIASGDDTYQVCILHPYYSYNSFISQNYAFDFYQFNSLDLTQPYWNKTVIDNLSIDGKAYIGLGDFCSYSLNILYANKNRLKDAQRTMPYESVRNGKWTMDEFFALTKDLYVDANGDGKRNNGDIYGFAGMWDANGSAMMQAANIYVASKDEDGRFIISMEGDRMIDFYDKLYTWSRDESTYLWSYGDRNNEATILPFLDGRSYFNLEELGTMYLSANFDVGILPLPKYDVSQDNYKHVNWGNNIVVPTTIKDTNMVGDVLEMMSYFSRTVVQTAYYDTVLQFRVSNAPEDREMVELIYNTVVYDPGIAFCDGSTSLWTLVYVAGLNIMSKTKKISSVLRSNSKKAQAELDKIMERVQKNG